MDVLLIAALCVIAAIIVCNIIKRRNTVDKNDDYVQYNYFSQEQFSIRDKQFHETIQLITSTKNPDTFFSRIEFAYEIAVEQQCSDWVTYIDNNLDKYISDFITRSCKHELVKIQKLKTDVNKENNYSAYCDIMRTHFEKNRQYTEAHIEQLENELSILHDKLYTQTYSAAASDTEQNVRLTERSVYAKNVSTQVFEVFRKAIFLNWASHGYEINSDDCFYPQYMKYDLEIASPRLYHQKLVNEGLLCECDVQEKLAQYKAAELKELLQKYGIPPKKSKQELIKAVLQLDEDILIKETAHLKRLKLTPDGEAFLDLNNGFVQHYRCKYGFPLAEYVRVRENGILNYDEAAEIILLQRDRNSDYNSKLCLAQLYYKLKKYDFSLSYYIQTLYYGCEDKYGVGIVFAPHVVNHIHKLGEYYKDEMIDQCVTDNPAVKSVYSKRKFKQIVSNIISTGEPN